MPLQTNRNVVRLPIEARNTRAVSFPKTANFPLPLIGASLIEKLNSHSILTLEFAGKINNETTTLISGDPVVYTWGNGGSSRTFIGYVHSVIPTTMSSNRTRAICVSPSYVLKNTDQKIYTNVTADAVVKKITAKHGLKAVTQRHPRVFKSIVQAGQSDWQVLRRLATQTGFALRCDGTTIYFMSKDKMANSTKASAPYFWQMDQGTGNRSVGSLGSIISFTPTISDEAPDLFGATVDRVINGIHATTGAAISTSHSVRVAKKNIRGIVIPSEEFFL